MVKIKQEVHTLEIEKRYEKLKYEIDVIEKLKLKESSSMYGNDKYELKMFNWETKEFYSVDAYDLENELIVLLVSKLRNDHSDKRTLEDKFDDYFIEVSFEEYKSKYLPLLDGDNGIAKSFIEEINK